MLVGNRNNSAQNKSNNWAFVARRIGSVPEACSVDAHWLFSGCPSVGP